MFSLEDYVALVIMTPDQAGALRDAVCARKNILVAGGTSTGKTALTTELGSCQPGQGRLRRAEARDLSPI
ncbi:Flp pilus assembly CpaF family ATPase [Bradyrhizobium sp. LM6.10]